MKKIFSLVLILLAFSGQAWAASDDNGAPEQLSQWRPWVLYGYEDQYLCPQNAGRYRCAWPVTLDMDLTNRGGAFTIVFELKNEGSFPLPGGDGAWPENLMDENGRTVPVLGQATPSVWLPVGRHRLTGRFDWPELPETISLPAGFVLNIKVNGQSLDFPPMEMDYGSNRARLWLARKNDEKDAARENPDAADHLTVTVSRLIHDSQPQMITTRLKLVVSGRAREALLSGALLPETKAAFLSSPLPAQLDGDGLRVRIKPGTWEIYLNSRGLGRGETVGPVPENAELPEIWAFQAENDLRQVEVSGAPQIDQSQADLPPGWRGFPIYILNAGQSLELKVLRRGESEPKPDNLNLNRECWLDYDGGGLSCADHLTGEINRKWFLAATQPFSLAHASLSGQPQVITWQTDSQGRQTPGLQLRGKIIDLKADLRLDDFSGVLPASGWDQKLNTSVQKINLPPGYRVFHVSGADNADGNRSRYAGSWTSAWGTLDFFIVLIISIATWKLFGRPAAVLALAALIFCYHEPLAPRMVFLHLLACAALLRLLVKPGKARFLVRSWRFLAALTLIIISALFFIYQVRITLYPQLEDRHAGYGSYSLTGGLSELGLGAAQRRDYAAYSPEPVVYEDEMTMDMKESAAPSVSAMGAFEAEADNGNNMKMKRSRPQMAAPKPVPPISNSMVRLSQSPDAKIQNSAARPEWKWKSINLYFNSSVSADQKVRLFIVKPGLNRLLGLARIALMAAFLVVMLRQVKTPPTTGAEDQAPRPGKAAAAAAGLLLAAMLAFPAMASARNDFPDQALLGEYRQRLLNQKKIPPAGVPEMRLKAEGSALVMEFTIEAAKESVVSLPTLDREIFRPEKLSAGELELPLLEDGGQWLTLIEPGRTKLTLAGRLKKPSNAFRAFQINLPGDLKPKRVVVDQSSDWKVEGLEEDGQLISGALYLTTNDAAEEAPADGDGEMPADAALDPFFMVRRTISLGLEWQVHTTVTRQTQADAPVSLKLPLLPGEKPITGEVRAADGLAVINLGPNETAKSWTSTLDQALELTLTAGDGLWAESWVLDASPIWRVAHRGLVPVNTVTRDGGAAYWQPNWRPWPGESLTLTIDRPKPVPGRYLVIDQAALNTAVGETQSLSTLNFKVRTSQGGPWSFSLPAGAEVQTFTVDGRPVPLSANSEQATADGRGPVLTASLSAGSRQIEASWINQQAISGLIKTPVIDLGSPTANIRSSLNLPANRWILFVGGPLQGPAVQFWPLLAVTLLAAAALKRYSKVPLKTASWFLLGLGLIQFNILAAMIVAGWLLLLSRRGRVVIKSPGGFNLWQIVLSVWTLVSLILIYKGIEYGLLRNPDMLIDGGGSYGQHLSWFIDRASGLWPSGWVLSVPVWAYKALMLAWSLWLAVSLVGWLKWGWQAFTYEGLWKKSPPRPPRPRPQARTSAPAGQRPARNITDEEQHADEEKK